MPLRRSAKTAVPSKRKSLAEPQFGDEDSERYNDFEGELKLSPAKRRPTIPNMGTARKRTKITKVTESERKKTGKKRDVSLLTTMPLDILFTIFGMLFPRDLINLSRVDANFCRILTAHNVSFVWKAAREAEGVSEPLHGIPEYRWVNLLCGNSVCDFCRAKKATVDWMLRRRVCKRCLKSNLICASRITRRFPDVNDNVLSLIPLTNVGPRKKHARSGYYWISDIMDTQARMKELEVQPQRLAEFRTERKNLVEGISRDAGRCRAWTRAYARKTARESGRRRFSS
ncbi:uncharacterized protein BT62DRAFT_474258 [Guyanagaster necrorhizus]|uniref:F-box domain-containing protein n=1 Tax=Guyanagaster necrorhizus TaxID=856835 RepID=A0A9P7VIC3_9AGAR|nr:uncharacterized protein BT62DRAFT_474258 [Guyanagaster necrorhizus MCA 3950]KAG7441586.1 hypothetical protein BT62DRAFT_474258 [Guyanagaster necrorhizus MCA 3950]